MKWFGELNGGGPAAFHRSNTGPMKRFLTQSALVALFFVPLKMAHAQTLVWSSVLRDIRGRYPAVEQVSVDSLVRWLGDPSRAQPLLVDVRKREEYEISHLAGAIHVDPDSLDNSQILAQAAGRPIVLYCSVGYRSSARAQALLEAGATQVANLEGSIFMWANQGHPVERGGATVEQVHPYNRIWGMLLDRRLRSDGEIE